MYKLGQEKVVIIENSRFVYRISHQIVLYVQN